MQSIGVRASTHIFKSSESIGVLARARGNKNMCTRTYQIMRAYVRVRTHIFQYSESFGVLARACVP
jgi:hypothetical protein